MHFLLFHWHLLLCRYFNWIDSLQRALLHWKNKIVKCEHTYDEVVLYKDSHEAIMSAKIHPLLLLEYQAVLDALMDFCKYFDKLNVLLLLYFGNKWCTFSSSMEEYGVRLPERLHHSISKYVSFPDQDGHHLMENLGSLIPPYADGDFKPGVNITLRLHRDVTFKELRSLVTEMQTFQQPLLFHQDLVFFKNEATLFNRYLQDYLDSQVSQVVPEVSSNFPGFLPTIPSANDEAPQGTSMETFVKGLEYAHELIFRVMSGTVTYSEMTAGDDQMLKDMDTEREFAILRTYAELSNSEFSDQLSGVQSILELPQYITHCENIQKACEQYHLKGCLQDSSFQEMLKIMEENSSNEVRSKITPNGAKELMGKVKKILCLTEKSSSKYLNIFEAMMNSVPFYQFVKEKNFYGEQGQAMFRQQYQLITAQLQHEHYDEQVLNQLEPAFKAIVPFMNSNQNFTQLMTAVTDFANPEDNLKHLETVNANIMTIQKWFSRAEVSIMFQVKLFIIMTILYYRMTHLKVLMKYYNAFSAPDSTVYVWELVVVKCFFAMSLHLAN